MNVVARRRPRPVRAAYDVQIKQRGKGRLRDLTVTVDGGRWPHSRVVAAIENASGWCGCGKCRSCTVGVTVLAWYGLKPQDIKRSDPWRKK